jgi:hypothetical protein
MIEQGESRILARGTVSAEPFGADHAAGLAAALAAALDEADANALENRDPDQLWGVRFGVRLEESNSAKVSAYHAVIREPVADLDW